MMMFFSLQVVELVLRNGERRGWLEKSNVKRKGFVRKHVVDGKKER